MALDPLAWCRERHSVPGHPLSASLLFIEAPERQHILALRSVVAEIASVSSLWQEPGVAMAKLGWWREALVDRRQHPAIEALVTVGADDPRLIQGLIGLTDHVAEQLHPRRYETLQQAWSSCLGVGGSMALLEHQSLTGQWQETALQNPIATLGAMAYWLRLIRDVKMDAEQERWFVPLDVQADYQISRASLVQGPQPRAWAGLVHTLISYGIEQAEGAKQMLIQRPCLGLKHLFILHALDHRLASKMASRPDRLLTHRVLPSHAGNVWVAWRAARRWSTMKA